ncbi:hypothetical protein CY831_02545 [Neisseria gonorrhoeae]
MIFQTVWFSDVVLSVSWIVLILILAASAPSAFRSLARYRSALPLCTVIFSAAWCLNASVGGGQLAQMNYHLLAVNLVTLMVDTSAALLMLPYCLLFAGSAGAYPPNALVLILPALVVNRLSRMLVNRLPPNIFIFIFVNGFLASAAGILLTGLVLIGILDAANAFPSEILWTAALPVFILLAWAEAFLSGISTAIFVALKPHWINTFDDNRYLKSERGIWL